MRVKGREKLEQFGQVGQQRDQMQRNLRVVLSHNWPKAKSSRNLEAAASESWENWWEQDERDEQDRKKGPQTLPAAFWGLRQKEENQTCVRDLGLLLKFIHLRVDKEQRLENIVQMVT